VNSVEARPRLVSGHLDRAAMGRFEVFLFSAIACVLVTRATRRWVATACISPMCSGAAC